MQWNEKCFFSKETPSLKCFSQHRRLKRSSGFHRPEKSHSVDGTTSLEEAWKAENFHPGRNYRCVDGVFSQNQLGRLPAFKRLVNIRCIGKTMFRHILPSRGGILQTQWIEKLVPAHLPSCGGMLQTQWIEKACFGTFFHRPEVYIKCNGINNASFLRRLHRWSTFLSTAG